MDFRESYFILQEPTLGAHIKFITTLEHLLGSTASVLGEKKLLSSDQIWKHMRDFASLLQQTVFMPALNFFYLRYQIFACFFFI